MSWEPLDAEETKSQKVLGADATFPKRKVDPQPLVDKFNEAKKAFIASADDLEKLLEAYEDAIDAYKNGLKVVAASYEASDFGLDDKKDAKKTQAAHKIFSAFFAQEVTHVKNSEKATEELERHLELLGKYKGPAV
jgi:hypothetical protein